MSVTVEFSRDVTLYLANLARIFVYSGYFYFYENSVKYIQGIINEIILTIHLKPKKSAPSYFLRYGKGMLYITCKRNRTTWYVFFTIEEGVYHIRYITNNHVAGHHF
jgi:hypothetical protein